MDKLSRKNIKAYDETVEKYHELTKDLEPAQIKKREEFINMLPKKAWIIDIGCGPGRDALFFTGHGLRVTGIDLSKKTIVKARLIAPKADFQVMDFRKLSFPDELFDGAWFGASIFCVEKSHAGRIIENVYRILKKNGVMNISFKEGKGEGFELDKRYDREKFYAYYTEEEVRPLLLNPGFKIHKITRSGYKSKYHTHPYIQYTCIKDD